VGNAVSFLDIKLIDAMNGKMGYLSERQAVISENIANANTPDYRAKDLPPANFNAMVEESYNKLPLTRTSASHLSSPVATSRYSVIDDPKASETIPMGNNVVLEDQALKLTQTSQDYQLVAQLYRKINGMMRLAVQPNK
jgi:flagellar basal-body rod protein FlgB